MHRLERRKVRQVDPIPTGHQHVLRLDIAVIHLLRMDRRDCAQELIRDPFALQQIEERAGANQNERVLAYRVEWPCRPAYLIRS